MRIPGTDEALEHLARWAGRGRWKEECMRAIAAHFEPGCAKSGISEDELAEALGEFHYEMVEACAFEDFCSRRPASRRSNVIDDYLDQRGWKASIQARDYLRAGAPWMPVLVGIRVNPLLRAYYRRLRGVGKRPKVAKIACMHKLLAVIYSVAKDRRPFVAQLRANL